MLEEAKEAVRSTVPGGRVGVAFSGGVDSSLLAKMCVDMGYDVTLLTVGFAGSHDIESAAMVNGHLGYDHRIREISPGPFRDAAARVRAAIPGGSPSWIENGIAFYYVAQLARDSGIGVVATANGIDELFCGYDAYRREYHMGRRHLLEMVDQKVQNELDMMGAIKKVALWMRVDLVQPFLSADFVRHAAGIPVDEKITGPGDYYRKHPVRALAREIGVPEVSCSRRKKALQYGSRIHRMLSSL